MVFSGIVFLYVFLPLILLVYRLVPSKLKNAVLLLASVLFFFYGEGSRTWILILTAVVNGVSGKMISKYRVYAKQILVVTVVYDIGQIVYWKYADFLIGMTNSLLHTSIPYLNLIMPLGISFFTFQAVSYVVDVYRGKVKCEDSILDFAMYLSFFPQLIAGPIVRYQDIENRIHDRTVSEDDFAQGVVMFVVGLGQKVLIADTLGALIQIMNQSGASSVIGLWLCAASFTMQLYHDFCGYSRMAVGLGKMFGFTFPKNFNYPLSAVSMTDFWRRWHMTLSGFFRDYVYIPLGGNRVSKRRWLFNMAVVWLLTGIWHGAGWNFIVWGLYNGVILIMEKTILTGWTNRNTVLNHVCTFLLVVIGFVIFSSDTLSIALNTLKGMAGMASLPLYDGQTLFFLHDYMWVLLSALCTSFPLVPALRKTEGWNVIVRAEPLFVIIVLLAVTSCMVNATYSPFLYFRF
ncbi:MAG: MBOAT family O-acyltransferase [Bulleidia sp.]